MNCSPLKNKFSTLLDKLCEGSIVSKSPQTYLWHLALAIYCTKITDKLKLADISPCSSCDQIHQILLAPKHVVIGDSTPCWANLKWVHEFDVFLTEFGFDVLLWSSRNVWWTLKLHWTSHHFGWTSPLIGWFYFTLGDVYKMSENGEKNDPLPKVTMKQILTFPKAVISE